MLEPVATPKMQVAIPDYDTVVRVSPQMTISLFSVGVEGSHSDYWQRVRRLPFRDAIAVRGHYQWNSYFAFGTRTLVDGFHREDLPDFLNKF